MKYNFKIVKVKTATKDVTNFGKKLTITNKCNCSQHSSMLTFATLSS